MSIDLPYIDEHAVTIAAPRDQVWAALQRYTATSIGTPGGHPLARLLGANPPSGFAVTESVPGNHLILTGRHRFSRYALVFELEDPTPPRLAPAGKTPGHAQAGRVRAEAGPGTVLCAKTYAAFPGIRGRAYRALVIGTRAHVLATTHMLRAVQRLTLQTNDS